MANFIGARIKALREERKLSQDDLARVFGFKDRQTVSAIETGERRVTAEELVIAVEKLGASLDYFTNPFLLVGEGRFSWRQTNVGTQALNGYERSAGRWIAAYRALSPQVGRAAPLLRRSLGLTPRHSFEDAMEAGERFVAEFELGDVPADRLAEIMERALGILVLRVDAFDGISGAACRLPELDVVLINRNEVEGRRNFDLAHELFHILTWDTMPPEHSEAAIETGGNRVEQLANNFASAVLMPAKVLDGVADWSALAEAALVARLNGAADQLKVTASALKWRLVALNRLKPATARAISSGRRRVRSAPSSVIRPCRGRNRRNDYGDWILERSERHDRRHGGDKRDRGEQHVDYGEDSGARAGRRSLRRQFRRIHDDDVRGAGAAEGQDLGVACRLRFFQVVLELAPLVARNLRVDEVVALEDQADGVAFEALVVDLLDGRGHDELQLVEVALDRHDASGHAPFATTQRLPLRSMMPSSPKEVTARWAVERARPKCAAISGTVGRRSPAVS